VQEEESLGEVEEAAVKAGEEAMEEVETTTRVKANSHPRPNLKKMNLDVNDPSRLAVEMNPSITMKFRLRSMMPREMST